MKAILLAGGMGTRLHPLTLTCPKPLLPIGNLPIIARIIFALRKQNIREFIFLLHYQPEAFIDALGDGSAYDASFEYATLEKDLSTAGSVRFIRERVRETCLIHSADILAEAPVHAMLDFHRSKRSLATIALYPQPAPLSYGIVRRQPDGRIRQFLEKPTWPEVFSDWVNAGVYLIEPELVDHIPESDHQIYFEKHVFPQLAAAGAPLFGFPITGYWRDVGTPEDLRVANMDFLGGQLPPAFLTREEAARHRRERTFLAYGESNSIASTALLSATVIKSGCQIAAHAKITRSVLLDNVSVLAGASIDSAIIMGDACIGEAVNLLPNSLIGEGAEIAARSIIQAHGIVNPRQRVSSGQIVPTRRVLPTGYLRGFVDGGSVMGKCFNNDFLTWLGKAFGSRQALAADASSEPRRASILLCAANAGSMRESIDPLVAGLTAVGCEVAYLRKGTLPLTRHLLFLKNYSGGIYVGKEDDTNLLRVALLNGSGEDLTSLETCSLEFVELLDNGRKGSVAIFNERQAYEGYLQALVNAAPSRLDDCPAPVSVSIANAELEPLLQSFVERLHLPLRVNALPGNGVEASPVHANAWHFEIDSAGEKLKGFFKKDAGRRIAISDGVLAELLQQQVVGEAKLLFNWLMLPACNDHESPHTIVPGVKASFADFARREKISSWLSFDGRGGIAISAWQPYPDAFVTLANLLPTLASSTPRNGEAALLQQQLLSCKNELKAMLMRRLLENFAGSVTGISDGIRLGTETEYLIVRPGAGMDALQIFYADSPFHENRNSLAALAVKNLAAWIKEEEEGFMKNGRKN